MIGRRAVSGRLLLALVLCVLAALAPFNILADGPQSAQESSTPTVEPSLDPTLEPSAEPTLGPLATRPYVVRFATAADYLRRDEILAELGLRAGTAVDPLRLVSVAIAEDGLDATLAELRASPAVASVEPDRARSVEGTPDDELYAGQWALERIGWPAINDAAPAGDALVAVLDTGVAAEHPDLAGQVVEGASFVDGVAAGEDANGHGTAMAGIIAALDDNSIGIAGAGMGALKVLPVTVIGAHGNGRDIDVIAGVVYAVDRGADVILMAFSSRGYSDALQAAVDYAWQHDVVVVAAAGNDASSRASYPAGDAGVIGVAATTAGDSVWSGSNLGASVFLAAPGVDIATTGAAGDYLTLTGTSPAAAYVAAAAGLLRAREADLSNAAIVGRLARSAAAVGDRATTGNGRLDLARAWSDTSTERLKPAGAHDADGGPFVGPYLEPGTAPLPAPAPQPQPEPTAAPDPEPQPDDGEPVYGVAAWYATAGWSYRKPITIDHNKVAATLSNFPVLISLSSDSGLAANAQSSGNDILFTAADGTTKLSHQIETYSSATGALVAWVRIPSLSGSTDTTIYMYYGNASASNQQNASGVWDSSYSGVWHLPNGSSLSAADSTANARHGSIVSATATSGKIDGGANFSGGNWRITLPGTTLSSSFTASVWFKTTGSGVMFSEQNVAIGSTPSSWDPFLYVDSAGKLRGGVYTGSTPSFVSSATVTNGAWHYAVVTVSSSSQALYLDGSLVDTWSGSPEGPYTYVTLGAGYANNWPSTPSSGTSYFPGQLDEARLSSSATARSANWIATEWNNQNSPSSFYSVGSVEGNTCTSSASGSWNTSSIWSCGHVPGSGEAVVIGGNTTVTVSAAPSGGGSPRSLSINSSATLVIDATRTLSIAGDISVDGTLSNAGTLSQTSGSTTFNAGSAYEHNQNGGSIPVAAWSPTSTIAITGWTSSTTAPSNINQAYGNFTWNSPSQTASVSLAGSFASASGSVAGTLSIVSTGSGSLRLLNSGSSASLSVGTFSQTGGTFAIRGTGTTSATSFTLDVAGSFSLSGGELRISEATSSGTNVGRLNIGGNVSISGGTLTRTGSAGTAEVVFNGSAPQTFARSGGTLSGGVDFSIASGASVSFGTSVLDGSTGSFTLASGAALATGNVGGIAASGSSGSIRVSGTRSFSSGATYTYDGSSAQVTGSGLPSAVAGLTIANLAGVTLSSSLTVNGTLTLSSGTLKTGANSVSVASGGSVARSSGWVSGNLRRYVPTGSPSLAFDIGDDSTYAPLAVAFSGVTAGGYVSASTTAGEHPSVAGSPINATADVNRYWTLSGSGLSFASYTSTFSFATGEVDGGASTSGFVVGRYASGWTLAGSGTRTATSTQGTGITGFGDFVVGQPDYGIFSADDDVGSPGATGSGGHASGTYTVSGAGTDIWNTADGFNFLYTGTTGDVRITARVVSVSQTDAWAKAGVMIRETTAAGSVHAMSVMTPSNGMAFQWRPTTNGSSLNSNTGGISAPYWVRLTRSGDTFTAERSVDGVNWSQEGSSESISMAANVYVGLAVTSHNYGTLSTAVFDNVSIDNPPSVAADLYVATPATQLSVSAADGVLANDSDAQDDTLSASLVAGASHGTLNLQSDGSFTYTPYSGFVGSDSFSYRAYDGALYSAPATVTLYVIASVGFQAEDYVSGTATGAGFTTVDEGTALGGQAIRTNGNNTNASGPPSERVRYDLYFPSAGASNTYHIYVRYRMSPADTNHDSAWALDPLDGSPTSSASWEQINDLYLNGSTAYKWVDLTAATGINGAGAYTNVSAGLHSWWFGGREAGLYADAFVFSTGFNLDLSSAGQAILDAAVNDRPTSAPDTYSTNEDTPLNVAASGVLANDSDPEDDALSAVLVSDVSNGSLMLNANGSFSYMPAANFYGTDSFTYRAWDLMVGSASAATVTISVNAVNDAPSFSKGANQVVNEDAGPQTVAGWATSISPGPANESGQAVDFIVSNNNDGLFAAQPAVSSTGTLTYTPAANTSGSATVSVRIHDDGGTANGGSDTSATQTFTITVNAVNDAPLAGADAYSVVQGNTLVVGAPGVLANDSDPESQALTVGSPRPVSGPANGSLTLNADGSFSYTPNSGFAGTDSFTYVATDGSASSAAATVTISVNSTALISAAGWSTSFSSGRYLALTFPAYVPAGATVEGATFYHAFRSYLGGTTCYYVEAWSGGVLIGSHGSAASPLACNSGSAYVTNQVSLPEVNSPARADDLTIRIYVRNSAGGRSEHSLGRLGVTYWLGN